MRKYLNNSGIPLSVAVFLASDYYDHDAEGISATSLIKPIRQTILASRLPPEAKLVDIVGLVNSRIGSAIHDAIERAWKENRLNALQALGYPNRVMDAIVINPEPGTVKEGQIPVYMEQRQSRVIEGVKVSGKYDFIADGRIEDFKSTKVFTYTSGNKTEDYQLQGSIYRWLNPQIVTQDEMAIQFIFLDWQAGRSNDPAYPSKPMEEKLIPLLSLDETEAYVRNRIRDLKKYENTPEENLPLCSDKELWRTETTYKYYKNPEKRTKSTKNFDSKQDAYKRLAEDGGKGIVVEVPGQVIACKYCDAFPLCTQKDALIQEGSLIL